MPDNPSGKILLVTGATSGLGKAAAFGLARRGATVILLARVAARGAATLAEIRAATPHADLHLLIADLASPAAIRAAVQEFERRFDRLNVLINSAAVFLNRRQITPQGLEMTFATNYLGPFLLSNLLIEHLARGAPARVINVTAPSTTRIDLEDLQGQRKFSPVQAFGASKAANLLFTYALARRLQAREITVNAYHPGIVRTRLMREAPLPMRLLGGVLNWFGQTPQQAAEDLLDLACSDRFNGVTGQLIHAGKPVKAPFIDDHTTQERLWQASVQLTGLEEEGAPL